VKSGGVCPLTEMAKNKTTIERKALMVMTLSLRIPAGQELHLPGVPSRMIRIHSAQDLVTDIPVRRRLGF
jgi:hypothetical protein